MPHRLTVAALLLFAGGPLVRGATEARSAQGPCTTGWKLPGTLCCQAPNATIHAMTTYDDGDGPALYVAGSFTLMGGQPMNRIARWDGVHWTSLGAGIGSGAVHALAVFDDGSGPALYAGGSFTLAGGQGANRIARWDGTSWSALGSGLNSTVYALATYDGGSGLELYAGGDFSQSPNNSRVARWSGGSWVSVGQGLVGNGDCYTSTVRTFAVNDSVSGPSLYAGGVFQVPGHPGAPGIARWNGIAWTPLGSGVVTGPGYWCEGVVGAIAGFDDGSGPAIYVAGLFDTAGGQPANGIARWNGSAWSALGQGLSQPAYPSGDEPVALQVFDDGSGAALYVGGIFTAAGGQSANRIARWDGSAWTTLENGLTSPGGGGAAVHSLTIFDDGQGAGPELHVGGAFTHAGDQEIRNFARWGCLPATLPKGYCFGSEAVCPCGNPGGTWRGCGNSTGMGAVLGARANFGSYDDLVLQAGGMVPGQPGLLFAGLNALNSGNGIPFGDGLRCVWGGLVRIGVAVPDAAGRASWGPGLSLLGGWQPGDTRHFQVWYRDPVYGGPAGFGCVGQNLTNGLEVRFLY